MLDATVLLNVLALAINGDATARMPVDSTGVDGLVAESINTLLASVIRPTPVEVAAEAVQTAAIAQARDAALASIAMQNQFAASASHELRTPTMSILGFVEEVLDNNGLSEEDRGFLEIVHRNAQRLSRLIDDLLILGQVEIDTTMMHLELTALVPLVEHVMSTFSSVALSGHITLVMDNESDWPSAVIDPQRFEQALTNVVGNAVKFTPSGGTVKVGVHSDHESVRISVSDSGMGIHTDDIERIFDRFYRARNAVETAVKGSGLGLAIAKAMIEAQHGQLQVRSTAGNGSTFTMSFPIAPDERHFA
jgi:signal transduction histidine kinase